MHHQAGNEMYVAAQAVELRNCDTSLAGLHLRATWRILRSALPEVISITNSSGEAFNNNTAIWPTPL
jgi:hypothetical protein